jgi:hypothetical protein
MTPLPSLPAPVSSNWDWQLDAACRDTNSDVFFHPPGERRRLRQQRISAAKQAWHGAGIRNRGARGVRHREGGRALAGPGRGHRN